MGLLNYITATSLDEDYAHVSRSGAGSRRARRGAAGPGTVGLVVLAVFGVLVATAAVQTSRNAGRVGRARRESLVDQVNARKAQLDAQRAPATSLTPRGRRAAGQQPATRPPRAGRSRSRLDRLGLQSAAASPATGPGIRVVVDDAPGATERQAAGPRPGPPEAGQRAVAGRCRGDLDQRPAAHQPVRDPRGRQRDHRELQVAEPAVHRLGASATRTRWPPSCSTPRAAAPGWPCGPASACSFDVNSEDSMTLPASSRTDPALRPTAGAAPMIAAIGLLLGVAARAGPHSRTCRSGSSPTSRSPSSPRSTPSSARCGRSSTGSSTTRSSSSRSSPTC